MFAVLDSAFQTYVVSVFHCLVWYHLFKVTTRIVQVYCDQFIVSTTYNQIYKLQKVLQNDVYLCMCVLPLSPSKVHGQFYPLNVTFAFHYHSCSVNTRCQLVSITHLTRHYVLAQPSKMPK